ncbi:urease accessory protein UreD [Mesobacterium sp. TK19101]|uniref:Urease accessory protein UreD n=1 Tax=Mesobacterium hydrothermale TaxID=3111907 RepID=A0ABU6HHS6_9RHOB|nr:urease accessory protein UreD [Mesobacterium sp. TK19101]MEC3861008.1 urease accessory protein UreD [Mesobacterium sp. TK19101]
MSGSLKLLFPRTSGGALQAVLLNTAGGITGGDRFEIAAEAEAGAHLTVTTQAAERIYRAQPGAPGHVRSTLRVASRAQLHWLPQETILFDGAALDRSLRIEAAGDARVLACETLAFGRLAMGERVNKVFLRDRLDLVVDGQLAFADRLRLDGDADGQLQRLAVAQGAMAMASVLLSAPDAARHVPAIRDMLPETGGASAITNDLVFVRLLAHDTLSLRGVLVPLLVALSATDLPRPWMI